MNHLVSATPQFLWSSGVQWLHSNICSAGEVIESQRNCFSLLVVVVWTNMNGILSESPGFCHTSVFMVLRCTVPPFVQKFVKVFDYQVSIYG